MDESVFEIVYRLLQEAEDRAFGREQRQHDLNYLRAVT